MKKRWLLNTSAFFLLVFSGTADPAWATGPTFVSSLPAGDAVWKREMSPVVLTSSILVSPGTTLTIEPGVEVRVEQGLLMRVEATLVAAETAALPIRIASNATTPAPGDCQGLIFTATSTPATLDADDGYLGEVACGRGV